MSEWAVELRPTNFDQMVGQEANREILKKWVETNTLPSTLIFYGRSGTGKTTSARIIPELMDAELIELDAASHNSVDDARQINEQALKMSLTGRHKIFLIDEAHGLSTAAYQVLLKTIEEPNPKVHFILSTTEYTKLPLTIRGRARMLKFYSVPNEQLKEYAEAVLEHKGFKLEKEIIDLAVEQSNGQVRDLLKIIQTAAEGKFNIAQFKKFFAVPDDRGMRNFINAVLTSSKKTGLTVLNSIDTDLIEWVNGLQKHIYRLLEHKYKVTVMDFGNNVTAATKVDELLNKFSDQQFGALLTELNKINNAQTAYANLYALLFRGVM
jgi:DNA polymerase III subunit gamma/tau